MLCVCTSKQPHSQFVCHSHASCMCHGACERVSTVTPYKPSFICDHIDFNRMAASAKCIGLLATHAAGPHAIPYYIYKVYI